MGQLKLAPQERRIMQALGDEKRELHELCAELSKGRAIPMTPNLLHAHIWKLRKKGRRVKCKIFYFLG